MDLRFTPEEQAFREEVRAFIRDNLPKDIRERMYLGDKASKEDIVSWQRILNKKGWAAMGWPKEYGGPGWTPIQKMIFLEENLLAPAPELSGFNITMIGPVLIQFGTEAQKKKFLPRAANLDDWWCQGFSEPGAGSDLASLKTSAKRDGDHYVINGSKIWTSTAHMADWVFLLVRTNPNARKRQEGISFILLDMKTPGITVRPIISIDGAHHLNETFYDDVRVPVENLVYEENKGWDVAKFLLGNERVGIARIGKSKERLRFAVEHARDMRAGGKPLIQDPAFRQRVAQLEVDVKALEITQNRVVSAAARQQDGKPDPLSSALKIKGSELQQLTTELAMDVGGPLSMPFWHKNGETLSNEPELGPDWASEATAAYLFLRAASIYGGSNEIQKNILTKAVLGL
jgi:alkylation response protein AidB-like acyl-CoA dehydrogenase